MLGPSPYSHLRSPGSPAKAAVEGERQGEPAGEGCFFFDAKNRRNRHEVTSIRSLGDA